GWTSNCSASCTSVRSPLIAAIATFALKADVWFRRGLLLMLSPDSRAKSCLLSGRSSTYRPVQIPEAGSPTLPDSYAPFNIVNINGALFVTFAKQNAEKNADVAGHGHGIVDIFELDGTFRQRFAQHGQLNSPWGVALAPTGFGELGGALWIGNFGNGQINAFDSDSGKFVSKVRDPKGQAILIDG